MTFNSTCDHHRFFHASEVVGRKIVVHGGWNETDTLGDIWIFNTDSFTWMQPRTSGTTVKHLLGGLGVIIVLLDTLIDLFSI